MGKTRKRNEDSLSVIPDRGVAVVADGMGGHPGGDVASRIAADTVSSVLQQALASAPAGAGNGASLDDLMKRSVLEAHEAIRAKGREEARLAGMGTTVTAMVVAPDSDTYVLGHVGDSRAYRLRAGDLVQLTRDDTWVQDRIESGQLGLEQAKAHPFAHLLTQCLGLDDLPVPHISSGAIREGDHYLLCTDGLVGMIDDGMIRGILVDRLDAEDPTGALQALLDAANEAGGHDNITAVLVTIEAM